MCPASAGPSDASHLRLKPDSTAHMINGAHAIIYSSNADADRAVLRDVFKLPHVDAGAAG